MTFSETLKAGSLLNFCFPFSPMSLALLIIGIMNLLIILNIVIETIAIYKILLISMLKIIIRACEARPITIANRLYFGKNALKNTPALF